MSAEAFHCLNSFPILHARDQQVVSAEESNCRYKVLQEGIMPHPPTKEALK